MWITIDAFGWIKLAEQRKLRVYIKVNSPPMLQDVLSIHFTFQRPVILTHILYLNPDISLNWYHIDGISLPNLCETLFSLQTSKRFALHSSYIHSPLMVMAMDFMGLFHYKGNKTAGYTEMQHGNHYSTARETIILTLSDFLSLTGCEAFMLITIHGYQNIGKSN